MQDFAIEQVELSQRLAMSQARMEAAALARKEQSRADRKAGRLTEGVVNGLRACTIPQLVRAKKLCDEFIWDQRHAPPKADCRQPFTLAVLLSIPFRNQRYQFEIVRNTRRAAKTYINGPLLVSILEGRESCFQKSGWEEKFS